MITPELVDVIPCQAVLLDHDDTGIKTRVSEYAKMTHVGELLGFAGERAVTKTVLDYSWGWHLEEQFAAVYGAKHQEALELYKQITAQTAREANDGYLELLAKFEANSMTYGIVSSHEADMIHDELIGIGADPYKHLFIHGAQETKPHTKPAKEVFDTALMLLKGLGIPPHFVGYIGDDVRDLRASGDAGMQFVGVTTGIHSAEDFDQTAVTFGHEKPYVVSSLAQIDVRPGALIVPSR